MSTSSARLTLRPGARVALAIATLVFVAWWPYRHVPSLSYCGMDAPVMVEQTRQGADLWNVFGREARKGIEPDVAFYRPLTAFSFALDNSLQGATPDGFHRTDLMLHVLLVLLVAALGRAFALPLWLALAAAIAYALHPLLIEVVPAPERRGDMLAVLALLLCSWGWLRAQASRRWWLLVVAAAGLAPLAKETGFVVPLVLASLVGSGRWWFRLAVGLACMVPAAVARSVVLGGVGGYGSLELSWRALPNSLVTLFDPAELLTARGDLILVAAIVAAAVWCLVRKPTAALVWAVTFTASTLALALVARGVAPWYLYPPVAAVVLGLAAMWHQSGRWARVPVAVVAVLLLLSAPIGGRYPEWSESSRLMEQWLDAVSTVAKESNGEPFLVAGVPRSISLRPTPRFRTRSAAVFNDHGLRSGTTLRLNGPGLVDLEPAAFVDVRELGAQYSLTAELELLGTLRLRAQGPVSLAPPVRWGSAGREAWRVKRGLSQPDALVSVEALADGSLRLSDIRAPLWLWNGEVLQLAPTPGSPGSTEP